MGEVGKPFVVDWKSVACRSDRLNLQRRRRNSIAIPFEAPLGSCFQKYLLQCFKLDKYRASRYRPELGPFVGSYKSYGAFITDVDETFTL